MPRPKRTTAETGTPAAPAPNSMVASAVAVSARRRSVPARGAGLQEWQAEGWGLLDVVGELRFATQWKANALSRIRLYVEEDRGEEGWVELDAGLPVDALNTLFGGEAGQAQMMSALALHMDVPGECYLVGTDTGAGDRWEVMSTAECKREGTMWVIDRGDGDVRRFRADAEDSPLVIRVWRSHPRVYVEADSPVRAALPILREVVELSKHVAATIDSRLAGAGVFVVPSEMSFAVQTPSDPDDPNSPPVTTTSSDLNTFIRTLTEAMVTARNDRGNAAAVAPVVVQAPGALIQHMKHITFSTPFDAKVLELREAAIRRLALSLDLPPEVLLGQADSNHWSAWQIDEAALKVHIAPLCELLVHALTTRFLWPVLEGRLDPADPDQANAEATPETRRYRIAYDDSDLRSRPNRSAEAMALHERIAISDAALLRETGMEESDFPDDAEVQRRLLLQIARTAASTPDLALAAIQALGISMDPVPSTATPAVPEPATQPAVEGPPPVQAIDARREPPQEQAAALVAAGELLTQRALERAYNRVGRRSQTPRPVEADRLDEALTGAWSSVEDVAPLLGVDPRLLTTALDSHARALLRDGQAYHRPTLAAALVSALPWMRQVA